MGERRLAAAVAGFALLFTGIVYLPDVGHGFLKDDFAWIASAKRLGAAPWTAFVADASGTFYRPIVTLSFAADHAAYGLVPFGYALTNLFLLIACAGTIVLLFRQLRLSLGAAVLAATVWLLNPHGINMSVLWLSGRTSLLMALLSCAALLLLTRGSVVAGLIVLLAGMLSKEDALLVPIIFIGVLWSRGTPPRRLLTAAVVTSIPAVTYAALRVRSHALTPDNAPAFYQLTWNPQLIIANTFGYLDRSATVFAVLLLLTALFYRAIPGIPAERRRLIAVGVLWFVAALAITVRVPVRSSLYAVFPSIGVALVFAVLFDDMRRRSQRPRGDIAVIALLVALLFASPLYRARNQRWVLASDVSSEAMSAVTKAADGLPAAGLITFEDEPVRFANFQDALGEAATDAVRLALDRPFDGRIVPQGDRSTADVEVARFKLTDGRVLRVR